MLLVTSLLLAAATQPAPSPEDRLPAESPAAIARRGLAAAARGDPAIDEVQAAAVRCSDPMGAEGAVVARSRFASLLPRLSAEVRFDQRTYRVVGLQGTGEVDYARYAPGWLAAVKATWDLGGLVSPPAERTDAKGILSRARRRDDALRTVTALYYERRGRRLAFELGPPAAPGERAAALLEIERLAAELDAITCGAFGGGAR